MISLDVAPVWHFAVLIPARDEEHLIGRCLRSVMQAQKLLPAVVRSEIVLVSDDSTDGTVRIARTMLEGVRGTVAEIDAKCVGAARAAAAQLVLGQSGKDWSRCWFANTDADCVVPPTWLLDQFTFALRGWTAVAGAVTVDSFEEHDPGVPTRFRSSYVLHPDGTHPHVHGANLGVRADAYLAAGGWAGMETAEDHDLWDRLGATGARRLSSAALLVATSGRRVGRAPLGFAQALAAHNEVPR